MLDREIVGWYCSGYRYKDKEISSIYLEQILNSNVYSVNILLVILKIYERKNFSFLSIGGDI